MARVPIVPTAVPASQTQASQGGATASKQKKPIKAGGEEFKDIAALRMRAKELMLVTPNGTAFKAKCVELLNEHAKLLDAQRELAPPFAELAIPEDEDDDDDDDDDDTADDSRRRGGGDDGDSSEDGSPETLGSVGNLGNSLAVATEEDLKSSACKLYKHLRRSGTRFMLELVGGGDDKRKQLVYCAARLRLFHVTNGASLGGIINPQLLIGNGHEFFPMGAVHKNELELAKNAAAAGGDGGGGGGNDEDNSREAIFTTNDFARLIATISSEQASEFVDAYRASLSKDQLDARMRNTDLFKGGCRRRAVASSPRRRVKRCRLRVHPTGIADVFNDEDNQFSHPDPSCTYCGMLEPNAEATFHNNRSGETLSKKWSEVKCMYSPVHNNFTKVVSGHHDDEERTVVTYLPKDKAGKNHKVIMYTHHTFYQTTLEDLATKSLPGGGYDAHGGGGGIERRPPKKRTGGITADELKDALTNDDDSKIATALAGIGAAQQEAAKRQKLSFFLDLDAKGLLNAEQKGKLTAALDKQLDSLN